MINTEIIQPPGRMLPQLRPRPGVRFGKPLDFSRYEGHGRRPVRRAVDDRRDHVRADAAVRPGVRRPVRRQGEEGDSGADTGFGASAATSVRELGDRLPDTRAVLSAQLPCGTSTTASSSRTARRSTSSRSASSTRTAASSTRSRPSSTRTPAIDWVRRNVLDKLPLAGRPGVALAGADPRRPAGVPDRAGRADRAVGLDGRLRPRGAVPAVGRHARAAAAIPRFTHELRQRWEDAGPPPLPPPPPTSTTRSPTPGTTSPAGGRSCDAMLARHARRTRS